MELQAALTMFAVNLKRIFKLMEENSRLSHFRTLRRSKQG